MREFFHGWRRKAGVAALVMALAVLCLWMRGQFASDLFAIPGNTSRLTVGTGYFGFGVQFDVVESTPQPFGWRTAPRPTAAEITEGEQYNTALLGPDRHWRWSFCGLQINKIDNQREIGISHWLFIAPLTLLSAYLLLVPSRQRPPSAS